MSSFKLNKATKNDIMRLVDRGCSFAEFCPKEMYISFQEKDTYVLLQINAGYGDLPGKINGLIAITPFSDSIPKPESSDEKDTEDPNIGKALSKDLTIKYINFICFSGIKRCLSSIDHDFHYNKKSMDIFKICTVECHCPKQCFAYGRQEMEFEKSLVEYEEYKKARKEEIPKILPDGVIDIICYYTNDFFSDYLSDVSNGKC